MAELFGRFGGAPGCLGFPPPGARPAAAQHLSPPAARHEAAMVRQALRQGAADNAEEDGHRESVFQICGETTSDQKYIEAVLPR